MLRVVGRARVPAQPALEEEDGNATSELPTADPSGDSNALPTESPAEAEEEPPSEARPKASRAARGAILSAADRSSFTRLAAKLGGASGLSVSGVGLGRKVEHAGSLNSLVAWSTSKVPVAMAVIDAGGQNEPQANLTAAITVSDNAAATRLWTSLGSPEEAAAAADAELRKSGDKRTQVESQTLRSGLTPFGQTAWALNNQTRFTAGLPCLAAGPRPCGDSWGRSSRRTAGASTRSARREAQGRLGPGIAPRPGRRISQAADGDRDDRRQTRLAVTIATAPSDGSHESGTRNLTTIARWLASHADVKAQPASAGC